MGSSGGYILYDTKEINKMMNRIWPKVVKSCNEELKRFPYYKDMYKWVNEISIKDVTCETLSKYYGETSVAVVNCDLFVRPLLRVSYGDYVPDSLDLEDILHDAGIKKLVQEKTWT